MTKKKPVSGRKSGDSPRKAVESPDSLFSIAHARIIDLVSEGEIEGFPHGEDFLRDVYFDETPVQNPDGSKNFKNFQVDARTGTQTQDHIPGFPAVENEIGVGVELKQSAPWSRAFSNRSLSAVRVRLGTPALSKTNDENGDVTGTSVSYAIDVSTDGGPFNNVITHAFTGKTTSGYERGHRIELPKSNTSGWVIRVRRITADSTTQYLQNKTSVISVTEIIDGKFRYPMSAVVGTQIDASQFQSVPTRAYHLRGRRIKVPANYDPVTRTYATTGTGTSGGAWDGTFKTAYSNNPAWVFYDLTTHDRYGLGHLVDPLIIDKWSLYSIAQYCDGTVNDGFGGTEPRMTCNLYIQSAADAWKVLGDLCSVFRGICYWAGGAIVPVADRPTDPVYTYTNANVVGGKFRYQSTGRKARHTAVTVTWNDMTDFGRRKTDYYDDPEGIARYGLQVADVVAVGCTSRGQAQRLAHWILYSEKLLTNVVEFGVGPDGTYAVPGQIVRLADKHRAGRRIGGRMAGATISSVIVDSMPDPAPMMGDTLIALLPSGVTESRTVSSVTGGTIHVSSPFTEVPTPQGTWAVEFSNLKTQLFRVLAVAGPDPKGAYSLSCMQHNPSIFDAVDFGQEIIVPNISEIPKSTQDRPAAVTITSVERAGAVVASPLLTADWDAPAGAVRYQIQWRKDDGPWSTMQEVGGTTADLETQFPGFYEAKVQAVNALGIVSGPTISAKYELSDQTKKPTVITDIETNVQINFDAIAAEEQARIQADSAEALARNQALLAEADARADAIAAEASAIRSEVDQEVAALNGTIDGLSAQVGDIMNADEHSTAGTYEMGELVKVSGSPSKLYRALQNVPAGIAVTNATYWKFIGNYSSLGEAVSDSVSRMAVAESRLNNTGGGKSIEAVATDLVNITATINNATTGLASKASNTDLQTVSNRLNDTGDGKSIETVASDLATLDAQVDDPATGLASRASNTRMSAAESRLNDTGAGKSIETVATDLANLSTTVSNPTTGLGSKASTTELNTVKSRLNNVGSGSTTIESLAQRVNTIDAEVDDKASISGLNALTGRVSTNEDEIEAVVQDISLIEANFNDSIAIANGSFELNTGWSALPASWQYYSNGAAYIYSGKRSLWVRATDGILDNDVYIPVVPGETVRSRVAIRTWNNPNVGSTFRAGFRMYDHAGVYLGIVTTIMISGDGTTVGWNIFTHEWVIPANVYQIRAYVRAIGLTTDSGAFFDAYEVEKVGPVAAANAQAISATSATVLQQGQTVSSHTSQLSQLTNDVAGKASTSTVNELTGRVEATETSTQANSGALVGVNATLNGLARQEGIFNGGFEYDGDWADSFTAAANGGGPYPTDISRYPPTGNTIYHYTGGWSIWVKPGNNRSLYNRARFDVHTGQKIKCSFQLRSLNANPVEAGARVMLGFRAMDKDGVYIANYYPAVFTSTGASRFYGTPVTGEWTVPAGVVLVQPFLYFDLFTQGGWFVDDVQVDPGSLSSEANAEAINTTNANVASIDGRVTANANDITSLTATVTGKASATAVEELKVSAGSSSLDFIRFPTVQMGNGSWNPAHIVSVSSHPSLTKSLLFGNGTHYEADAVYLPVAPGDKFRVRAWVNIGAYLPAPGRFYIGILTRNGGGASGLNYTVWDHEGTGYMTAAGTGGGWKEVVGTLTIGDVDAVEGIPRIVVTDGGQAYLAEVHMERITQVEEVMMASWSVTLDVNGYVTGVKSENSGTEGTFTVLADKFRIVSPGQTPKVPFAVQSGNVYINADLYMGNGRIVSQGGGYMKVQGSGFGVGNEFLEWYGPQMSIASCSRNNAVYYFTNGGDAYFGGTLSAGILKNAAQSTTQFASSVLVGPFSTNGGAKIVNWSMSHIESATDNNTNIGNGAAGSCSLELWRKIGTGAWSKVSGPITINFSKTSEPDAGGYIVQFSGSGGSTYTDTNTSTAEFSYEVRRTTAIPSSGITSGNRSVNTRITCISTED